MNNKLKCTQCFKKFRNIFSLKTHGRKYHGMYSRQSMHCFDSNCNFLCSKLSQYISHLNDKHEMNVNFELLWFSNEKEFSDWLIKIEQETPCNFLKDKEIINSDVLKTSYYYCSRSGKYRSNSFKSKKRQTKSQGTCKIHNTCPAHFIKYLKKDDGSITIRYVSTHLCFSNRFQQLGHIRLSKFDKKWVLDRLIKNFPFSKILNEARLAARDTAVTDRRHLLTIQDIHNIARANKIKTLRKKYSHKKNEPASYTSPDGSQPTLDLLLAAYKNSSSVTNSLIQKIVNESKILLYKQQNSQNFDIIDDKLMKSLSSPVVGMCCNNNDDFIFACLILSNNTLIEDFEAFNYIYIDQTPINITINEDDASDAANNNNNSNINNDNYIGQNTAITLAPLESRFCITTLAASKQGSRFIPFAFMLSREEDDAIIELFFRAIHANLGRLKCSFFVGGLFSEVCYRIWTDVFSDRPKRIFCRILLEQDLKNCLKSLIKGNKNVGQSAYQKLKKLMLDDADDDDGGDKIQYVTKLNQLFSELGLSCETSQLADHFHKRFLPYVQKWTRFFNKSSPATLSTPVSTSSPSLLPPSSSSSFLTSSSSSSSSFSAVNREVNSTQIRQFFNTFLIEKNLSVDSAIWMVLTAIHSHKYDHLTAICKGKTQDNNSEIERIHDEMTSLNPNSILLTKDDDHWFVRSENPDFHFYEVTRSVNRCHCQVKCGRCQVCIHNFACTCHIPDSENDVRQMCKHIHLLCSQQKSKSSLIERLKLNSKKFTGNESNQPQNSYLNVCKSLEGLKHACNGCQSSEILEMINQSVNSMIQVAKNCTGKYLKQEPLNNASGQRGTIKREVKLATANELNKKFVIFPNRKNFSRSSSGGCSSNENYGNNENDDNESVDLGIVNLFNHLKSYSKNSTATKSGAATTSTTSSESIVVLSDYSSNSNNNSVLINNNNIDHNSLMNHNEDLNLRNKLIELEKEKIKDGGVKVVLSQQQQLLLPQLSRQEHLQQLLRLQQGHEQLQQLLQLQQHHEQQQQKQQNHPHRLSNQYIFQTQNTFLNNHHHQQQQHQQQQLLLPLLNLQPTTFDSVFNATGTHSLPTTTKPQFILLYPADGNNNSNNRIVISNNNNINNNVTNNNNDITNL
ncbi:hypothetical protein HELRODRAFT_175437 [Helobdella robusta]|uniref:C2H2-type domain-containing protein n=1 Tax=Helobdella robusta TaxID=6412 RepID=T1F995_HELRO|nr:hypothetical protein HELRODRAFT_175437 [Helobdella robusta]ESO00938.1 hypothetical protein HELRODRAFT_175437 [Helobdella robusta]